MPIFTFRSLSLASPPVTQAWDAIKDRTGFLLALRSLSRSALIRFMASLIMPFGVASTSHWCSSVPASTSGSRYGMPYESKIISSFSIRTESATDFNRVRKWTPISSRNPECIPSLTRLSWLPAEINIFTPLFEIWASERSYSSIASVGGTGRSKISPAITSRSGLCFGMNSVVSQFKKNSCGSARDSPSRRRPKCQSEVCRIFMGRT